MSTPSEDWQLQFDSASCIHHPWANIDYAFKEFCLKGSVKHLKKKGPGNRIILQSMIPIFIINNRGLHSEIHSEENILNNTAVEETVQQQNQILVIQKDEG